MQSSTNPEGWIPLPSLAAIGWIPFYKQLKDVTPKIDRNGFTQEWPRAYDWLFDSGNYDPPDDLESFDGFLNIIKSKDYRCAFFIDQLRVYRTAHAFTKYDKPALRRNDYVGYTPMRFFVPLTGIKLNDPIFGKRGIIGGSSTEHPFTIDLQPDHLKITNRVDFRLCRFVEVVGGLLTFNTRGAPYAWMKMEFEVRHSGEYTLTTTGSAVPSQTFYKDWKKVESVSHDIFDSSKSEMAGFLGAGKLGYIGKAVRAPERQTGAQEIEHGKLW